MLRPVTRLDAPFTLEAIQHLSDDPSEFRDVSRLVADAVGPPGRRAFRLLAIAETRSAWLWVEREQLQALAMLVEQLLTGLPALDVRAVQPRPAQQQSGASGVPSVPPDVEFKVGQLALGFDESEKIYLLIAHEVDSDPNGPARFSCRASRPQLRSLAESIAPLLAAGRPRCTVCEAPLGSGTHVCPRANGHAARAAED